MAIGRLSIKEGKKGKATPHAKYIAREGKFAKTADKNETVNLGYGNMPQWAKTHTMTFWKLADKHERKNGYTYKEHEIALPRELNEQQNIELVEEWIQQELTNNPYYYAIHTKQGMDGKNQPHVHLMYSERQLDGIERDKDKFFKRANSKNPSKGGCKKISVIGTVKERKEHLKNLRHRWELMCNKHLEKNGFDERIDMRSLAEQGINREPLNIPMRDIQSEKGKADYLQILKLKEENKQFPIQEINQQGQEFFQERLQQLKSQQLLKNINSEISTQAEKEKRILTDILKEEPKEHKNLALTKFDKEIDNYLSEKLQAKELPSEEQLAQDLENIAEKSYYLSAYELDLDLGEDKEYFEENYLTPEIEEAKQLAEAKARAIAERKARAERHAEKIAEEKAREEAEARAKAWLEEYEKSQQQEREIPEAKNQNNLTLDDLDFDSIDFSGCGEIDNFDYQVEEVKIPELKETAVQSEKLEPTSNIEPKEKTLRETLSNLNDKDFELAERVINDLKMMAEIIDDPDLRKELNDEIDKKIDDIAKNGFDVNEFYDRPVEAVVEQNQEHQQPQQEQSKNRGIER